MNPEGVPSDEPTPPANSELFPRRGVRPRGSLSAESLLEGDAPPFRLLALLQWIAGTAVHSGLRARWVGPGGTATPAWSSTGSQSPSLDGLGRRWIRTASSCSVRVHSPASHGCHAGQQSVFVRRCRGLPESDLVGVHMQTCRATSVSSCCTLAAAHGSRCRRGAFGTSQAADRRVAPRASQ